MKKMIKIGDIIGLPLISTSHGEKFGMVQEILLNVSKGVITGFVLDKGGFLREKKIVDVSQIKSIGDSAITIPADKLKYETGLETFKDCINYKNLMGKPVYTHSGKSLGIIQDILVNEENGHIVGFEISEGIIHDILEGRGIIPFPKSTIYGKDTVVVPNYVIDFFEKNKENKELLLERLTSLEKVWEKAEEGADYWSSVEEY